MTAQPERERGIQYDDRGRVVFRKCAVCGVRYPSWLEDDQERCRCRRAANRAVQRIAELDPSGTMTFETISPDSDASLLKAATAGKQVAEGDRLRGIIMFGDPGRGKTHLMVSIMRHALFNNRVACWHNMSRLVAEVQRSYSNPHVPDALTVIESLTNHEIIMLDDLGKERDTEDTRKFVYDLIDSLYTARRTLIASTNLTLGEFEVRYDAAVRSRITMMCNRTKIEGKDHRRMNVERYGKEAG